MMRPADAARLLVLGAIWGSSFLFIEIGLRAFTPPEIVAGRLILGAATVIVLVSLKRLGLPRDAPTWRALLVMAIVSNVAPFFLITWGQQHIASGLAAILNSTTPLFTAALAAAFISSERLTAMRATGIVVGFVGVAVIVGVGEAGSSIVGELAVVLAALSYALGFIYAKRRLTNREHSPLRLSAGQLLVASLIALPAAGLSSGSGLPALTLAPTLSVAVLGIVGTGLAYVLYYRLVGDVGATTASFVTYLIPLFGVTLGWIFLDEALGWNTLLGAVLVISGIALAERGARSAIQRHGERVDAGGGAAVRAATPLERSER